MRTVAVLENATFSSSLQESMQAVVDFLRSIVEALPRDQMKDFVTSGRATVPENVAHSTV